MVASERTVTVRLRALITDYQAALRTAAGDSKNAASAISGSFAGLNKDLGDLGTAMTRRITLPLVGVGAGALKLANDFETSFAQMVGLAGVTGAEVDDLRKKIIALSQTTAVGPQKLAEALYFIRSSGIDAAHAMDVLTASAKSSAAGMGDPAVIARTVSAALNAYGTSNLTAAHATDVLVAAIREATFEPDALAGSLGTVIATASQMNISFDQLSGTLAVLSKTGLDANESTTALNAILTTLRTHSPAVTKSLEDHGLAMRDLQHAAAGPGGVVEAMRMLDRAYANDDDQLGMIIPNVRAFRGAMTILAQDSASVSGVMDRVTHSAGSLDEAFAAMKQTKAFEIKSAWVDLQVTLIQLGGLIAPIAAQVAGGISTILGWFQQLPHPLQELVVWIGIVTAAAGPLFKAFSLGASVLGPTFNLLRLGVRNLSTTFSELTTSGMSAGQALRTMGANAAQTAIMYAPLAILVTGLTMSILDNAQAAREDAQAVKAMADAIRDAGSVVGGLGNVLDNALKESPQLAAAFANAGVTVTEVAAAVNEGGAAWDKMRDRLIAGGRAAGLSELDFLGLKAVIDKLPATVANATKHNDDLTRSGVGMGSAMGGASSAIADAARVLGLLSPAPVTAVRTETELLTEAATFAQAAIQGMISAVDSLFSSTFDVSGAQQKFADSLADVDTAAKGSGGSAVDLTSKQRALEKATDNVTKAQLDLAKAEQVLADARKGPSAREKEDASLELRDAQLNQAQAQKAVADARKRLVEEQKKGKSGDVAGAQLDLRGALLNLEHAQLRVTDAQKNQNDVLHSGEETSKKVTDAVTAVDDAQSKLADTLQAVTDAEDALAKGGGGGPVADHARAVRGAFDAVVTSGQAWIDKMIALGVPNGKVITEIDLQRDAVKKLIDQYGDPDGKLAKFLTTLATIAWILAHPSVNLPNVGGLPNIGNIPGDLGEIPGATQARAGGGPVEPGVRYRIGEQGPEEVEFPAAAVVIPHDKIDKEPSAPRAPMVELTAPKAPAAPAAPAAPKAPAAPAAPAAPSAPNAPVAPAPPSAPAAPLAPRAPAAPSAPNAPVAPRAPSAPAAPLAPAAPSAPSAPKAPNAPLAPAAAAAPSAPAAPVAPRAPSAPSAPNAPLAPAAPKAPSAPAAPIAPSAPAAPRAPSAPAAPVAPNAPSAPKAPLAPSPPSAPAAPLAPAAASAPNAPKAPAAPSAPVAPSAPSAPKAPLAPAAASAPSAPKAPAAPSAPSAPAAPLAPRAPSAPVAPNAPAAPLAPAAASAPKAPAAPSAPNAPKAPPAPSAPAAPNAPLAPRAPAAPAAPSAPNAPVAPKAPAAPNPPALPAVAKIAPIVPTPAQLVAAIAAPKVTTYASVPAPVTRLAALTAAPMMPAANGGGGQTIVDDRKIQVVVELDGARVANSLIRLSKHSGGLPIRIRTAS